MGLIERRLPIRFSKIPGEDPSQIAFSPKIGNLHRVIIGKLRRVTIRRELMHADQINKFGRAGTDRWAQFIPEQAGTFSVQRGGGVDGTEYYQDAVDPCQCRA